MRAGQNHTAASLQKMREAKAAAREGAQALNRRLSAIRVIGDIALVTLTQGYVAVIDADCVALAARYKWSAGVYRRKDKSIKAVYAQSKAVDGGKKTTVLLHRLIAGTPVGMETDHIDGDGLNNRKSNPRTASKAQNQHNQKIGARNTSGHKGVSWSKGNRKWCAALVANGVRIHLGSFAELSAAVEAVSAARQKFHGEFGRTA